MTMKPFEIQGAQLKLGGVQLEAGSTGVVIPGVTQATSYRVEEVEDTGDQTYQFTPDNEVVVIDLVLYNAIIEGGDTSLYADYTATTDGEGYIDEIKVNGRGTYTGPESYANGTNDMKAYIGAGSASDRPLVEQDWISIPFKPKMRAGEIQTIGGGSADTGDITFDGVKIQGNGNLIELVPNSDLYNGGQYVKIYPTNNFDYPHVHITSGDNGELYIGNDYQYIKTSISGNIELQSGDWTNEGPLRNWKFNTDGGITFPDGSTQTTAYVNTSAPQTGYFDLMRGTNNNEGRWDGEAILTTTDGSTYSSYSYYDDNIGNMVGGIAKFNSTGAIVWAKNFQDDSGLHQYPRIASLEYFDLAPWIVALGFHYNNNTGNNEGFMFMVSPDGDLVHGFDTSYTSTGGFQVNDGVFYDENGPAAVVAGETYNENKKYTLTPIAPSTTDKLYVTWSDFNNSGLASGQQLTYTNNGSYWLNGYLLSYWAVASINGLGTQESQYMYINVSYNEAGVYSITSITGGSGYDQFFNQTLKVLGSNLGGVDGVNDLTFDFDWTTFTNAGQNYQNPAGLSNIQGTSISDVYIPLSGFDFSTVINTPQTDMFSVSFGNQAAIVKLGQNSWTVSIGSTNSETINSVAVDPNNGDVYAVGNYYDGATNKAGAVFKYNSVGELQWSVYVDSSDYTNIELRSVDLAFDGEGGTYAFITGDDCSVTKLNGSTGEIVWQVESQDARNNLNQDPLGTVTPEGDYIVLVNESNNYHLFVTKLSGNDGSVIWQKDISYHQTGNWNGELYIGNDYYATAIDCTSTTVGITGTTYYYDGNNSINHGYVINIPSDGTGNGTYGEWILSDVSIQWTTRSNSSTPFTPVTIQSSVTNSPLSMNSSDTNDTATISAIGGEQQATVFAGIERHTKSSGNDTATLSLDQNGKFIYYSGSNGNSTLHVPSNSDVALPIGFTVTVVIGDFNGNRVYVNSDGNYDVTIYAVGTSNFNNTWWSFAGDGNAGVYTIMKVDTDTWMIAGPTINNED